MCLLVDRDVVTVADPDHSNNQLRSTSAVLTCRTNVAISIAASLCVTSTATHAVGDGANDLPMMSVAGLSVAYHAKPKVREQAMVAINSGGLDRLLEVLA